jgi:hypothetical protein
LLQKALLHIFSKDLDTKIEKPQKQRQYNEKSNEPKSQ